LIHLNVPKLDLSKNYYVIFTVTASSSADAIPAINMEITANPIDIKVSQG
jgi:hypothetical protein